MHFVAALLEYIMLIYSFCCRGICAASQFLLLVDKFVAPGTVGYCLFGLCLSLPNLNIYAIFELSAQLSTQLFDSCDENLSYE